MHVAPPDDLRARVFRFTCDLFDYCEELWALNGMPRRIAYQLFDAGASIGATLEEARAAYSRRDFTAKNSISLKESREAKYWLRVADAKTLGDITRRERLLRESDELVAMLTSGVRRLQHGGFDG